MPLKHRRLYLAIPVEVAAAALGMALAGTVAAAEPAGGCPDVSGEYENRASEASAGQVYLSDLLGIEPGVTRIVFLPQRDGMILRAPRHDQGSYELFLPWSEFWCEGNARVLEYNKSNEALNRHEGKPVGGSSDRRLAFTKTPDGALLVDYSAAGSWITPSMWGYAPGTFSGQLRARFDPYKR